MSGTEVMPFEEQVTVSPCCLAPGSAAEARVSMAGQAPPAPVESALDEEISDFVTRHVLEQDAQLFDG